jgi:hypothetical protein
MDDKTHIFILYKDKKYWKWFEGSAQAYKINSLFDKDPYNLALKVLRIIKSH